LDTILPHPSALEPVRVPPGGGQRVIFTTAFNP